MPCSINLDLLNLDLLIHIFSNLIFSVIVFWKMRDLQIMLIGMFSIFLCGKQRKIMHIYCLFHWQGTYSYKNTLKEQLVISSTYSRSLKGPVWIMGLNKFILRRVYVKHAPGSVFKITTLWDWHCSLPSVNTRRRQAVVSSQPDEKLERNVHHYCLQEMYARFLMSLSGYYSYSFLKCILKKYWT